MGDILVTQAGQQRGPFTEAEVLRMVRAGELARTDLWWREGMANWEPLSSLAPVQGPPPIPDQPPVSAPLPPPLPLDFPPPRRPASAGSMSPLVIVLCVVGGLVAIIFVIAVVAAIAIPNIAAKSRKAALHSREAGAPVSADASPGSSSSAASAPAREWRENSLDVLKFKTPFAMKALDLLPDDEEANKLIVVSRALEGEDDHMYVMAGVVTYTDDARVKLDGAVKGALDGMTSSFEIPLPEYEAVKTTINGLPARQVDIAMDVKVDGISSRIGIRGLFVESGQRLVQLLVVQFEPGEEAEARAKEVLARASVAGPAGQ